MKIDFEKIELKNAEEFVLAAKSAADKLGAPETALMADGEHFDGGRLWTGPQPANSDANNPASYTKVKKEFASKNGIKDVIDGHRDGVVSREIEWDFTVRRTLAKKGEILDGVELTEDEKPNEKEQALIREARSLLTGWWNERRMLKLFQEATETLLKTTRSPIRIFVPLAAADEINSGKTIPLNEAINKIYVEACKYDQATVVRDDFTMKQAGIFVTEDAEEKRAEISYVDATGFTVQKVLTTKKATSNTPFTPGSTAVTSIFSGQTSTPTPDAKPVRMQLGGKLLVYEMQRKVFVTPQMRQSNKQLNKAKTLRGHNLNTAGFAETTLLNVDLPGTVVTDEKGSRFVPDPIQRGASIINSWTGIKYEQNGVEHIATPSIDRAEPSPVSVFLESERADYQDILEEGRQVHNLIAGDATATGVARIQARGNFSISLLPTKGEVDACVRNTIETVVAMAAHIGGEPGKFESLRANADCRIDTGPITPEEVAMFVSLWKEGIWSLERVQRATGVEDTDAEQALIEAAKVRLNPQPQAQQLPQIPPPSIEAKTEERAAA